MKSVSNMSERKKTYLHFNSIAFILNYSVCIISEIFTIEIQYSFILHKFKLILNVQCAYALSIVAKIG